MTTILVVNDSAVDRRVMEAVLQGNEHWVVHTAQNGRDALAKMDSVQPNLVVTDLQMPEMDGLQLVGQLRLNYPEVPIVLTTAHGSEDLAMEALDLGVASYVPKTLIAERLSGTVAQVLELTGVQSSHDRLTECLDHATLGFTLASDPMLAERLVEMLQDFARSARVTAAGDHVRLGTALQGVLLHWLFCGNMELTAEQVHAGEAGDIQVAELLQQRMTQPPYCDRVLKVEAKFDEDVAKFRISHQGPRFTSETFPDLGSSEILDRAELRGLILLMTYMDEVTLENDGRTVNLVKRAH